MFEYNRLTFSLPGYSASSVIPEMRCGYFHWVDTSTGGSSGPYGIIRSVLKKFTTYCYD